MVQEFVTMAKEVQWEANRTFQELSERAHAAHRSEKLNPKGARGTVLRNKDWLVKKDIVEQAITMLHAKGTKLAWHSLKCKGKSSSIRMLPKHSKHAKRLLNVFLQQGLCSRPSGR
jgi:hypothetical protein